MKFQLKDAVKLLPSASLKDLESVLAAIQKELDSRKLKDLVDYFPGIIIVH